MTSREPRACDYWVGVEQRHCHATEGVRLFLPGLRCPAHTPRALQGLDEIPPGPGDRAVASGKRRSNPAAFRAARAAVGRAPDPAPGLRLDPGQRDHRGGWIRIPNADFVCPACRETESASGDQVAHFATHITAEHQQRCPANNKGGGALPGTAAPTTTESSNS
ncbi:hypothetical protein [Streptomyces sp. NPDC020298]|uniref:hypothetical protein n=1 Tax=unclassified Streptomyces TaxID=2593676 RepID=UPI0033D90350